MADRADADSQMDTEMTTTTTTTTTATSDVSDYGIPGVLTDTARRKSRSHSLKDCHVQFDPVTLDRSKGDDTSITPVWRGDRNVEVQLGFLQFMHKYEVNFSLDGPFQKLSPLNTTFSSSSVSKQVSSVVTSTDTTTDSGSMVSGAEAPINSEELMTRNARVISVDTQSDQGTKVDIKMEMYVSTDKVLHEKCVLLNEDDGRRNVTLNFHAKVLSKDKGTPLLKKGIHCIEHYEDEESEYGN